MIKRHLFNVIGMILLMLFFVVWSVVFVIQSFAEPLPSISNGVTTRVSLSFDEIQSNGWSTNPAISTSGRYVVFTSGAKNIVPGDTNDSDDVFLYDRQTGESSRISVASDGTEGNHSSWTSDQPISADGRYIVFTSEASNLVSDSLPDFTGVFIHDRQTEETALISPDGGSPSISADGHFITFSSRMDYLGNEIPNFENIFVYDRQTENLETVSRGVDGSHANGGSYWSSISADGRFVAFRSQATNLIDNDTNDDYDIFVYDRQLEKTVRVSVTSDGTQGNADVESSFSISEDGHHVVFISNADNLVMDDTNGKADIFVHDMQMGETIRIPMTSEDAYVGSVAISTDGHYIAFTERQKQYFTIVKEDVFVYDMETGQNALVSASAASVPGVSKSGAPSISADGRTVAFHSLADDLVENDNNGNKDIFVNERTQASIYYSISGQIVDKNGHPHRGIRVSTEVGSVFTDAEGRYLLSNHITGTYTVTASNLGVTILSESQSVTVPASAEDINFTTITTNPDYDIERISTNSDDEEGNEVSNNVQVSANGRFVLFASEAWNLVEGDINWESDFFIRDLYLNETTRLVTPDDVLNNNNNIIRRATISGDGRFVTFTSSAKNSGGRLFIQDRQSGEWNIIADGFGEISADGRTVMFSSKDNLLVDDDMDDQLDVFTYDVQSKKITRVSNGLGSESLLYIGISADGRQMIWKKFHTIFAYDRDTKVTTEIEYSKSLLNWMTISPDGRYILFNKRTNSSIPDVPGFNYSYKIYDQSVNQVVDSGSGIIQSISADNRYITIQDGPFNLSSSKEQSYIIVRDRSNGEDMIFPHGALNTYWIPNASSAISANGQFVAFSSKVSDLIYNDNNEVEDVFVFDRLGHRLYLPLVSH